MKKVTVLLVLAFVMFNLSATDPKNGEPVSMATSQIKGKVIDSNSGEALAGVALKVEGLDKKIYSDLDGHFSFEGVSRGTYDIEINYVSYKKITLKEVHATSQEVKLKVELESVSAE